MALPEDRRWFFITGCQRSGTTLLRLILESHSEIFCFDEMESHRVLSSREYEGEIAEPLVGFKIPRFAEQLDQPEPYDYGLAVASAHFYGGQKVLFMVRDLRDTVASMLKLRGAKQSWLEDWAVPILRDKVAREGKFAQRWQSELALCERSHSLAAFGALYWAYKNAALLRYVEHGYAVLPVSYESLVATPRAELGRVCRSLGVDFEEPLLDHHQHAHGELYDGLTVGGTDPKRRIDQASVGQWPDWMTPADEGLASEIAHPIEGQVARVLAAR